MTSAPPRLVALDNPIRDYPWGSPTAIPHLLGTVPPGGPVAELWIGAHPDSPSQARSHPDRPGLDELIAADPTALLGAPVVAEFGPRLPFLAKLLAADRALSIQVHPNQAQARAGYQAEQTAGVPAGSAQRNYSDPHHKPELAYALSEFDALCGFRPVAGTAGLIDALAVPELASYRNLLLGVDGLRATVTSLLSLPEPARARLVAATVAGCRRLAASDSSWAPAAAAAVLAAEDFPGDIGAVIALLLNYVRLAPGEAIFLGAGTVHAYLRGLCLEVLANSDNVLRCGLTAKHIDVPELVRVADFNPLAEPRWPATETGDGASFRVPVNDFQLAVLSLDGPAVRVAAPSLVLAGELPASLSAGSNELALEPWRAAFVPAGEPVATLTGTGRAFVISTNLPV